MRLSRSSALRRVGKEIGIALVVFRTIDRSPIKRPLFFIAFVYRQSGDASEPRLLVLLLGGAERDCLILLNTNPNNCCVCYSLSHIARNSDACE